MKRSVVKRLQEHVSTRRGSSRVWLESHYDELHPALNAARPPWRALAKTAAEDGVVATEHTLRKAWLRIKRRKPASHQPHRYGAPVLPAEPLPAAYRAQDEDEQDRWARMARRSGMLPEPISKTLKEDK